VVESNSEGLELSEVEEEVLEYKNDEDKDRFSLLNRPKELYDQVSSSDDLYKQKLDHYFKKHISECTKEDSTSSTSTKCVSATGTKYISILKYTTKGVDEPQDDVSSVSIETDKKDSGDDSSSIHDMLSLRTKEQSDTA
jgi:hypothetical protein